MIISKITETDIITGKIESRAKLDYLEVQCILSNEAPSVILQQKLDRYCLPGQPDLQTSLQLLHKLAMHLRIQRLKEAAYAYSSSDNMSMDSWQAHILVEELLIWANRTVAEYAFDNSALGEAIY